MQSENQKQTAEKLFANTPANIRQTPELYKQFTDLFEKTFNYKPSCTCSFFNDLKNLKNHFLLN